MRSNILLLGVISGVCLTACSSDDSNDGFEDSYVQFYNAAENSKSTTLILTRNDEETNLGAATYGDVVSSYGAEPGSYQYTLSYTDESGEDIVISSDTISLAQSEKTILMLSGDYDNPVVTPIVFKRQDIDELQLYITDVSSKPYPIEVIVAETGAELTELHSIGTLTGEEIISSELLPIEDYTVYIKNADTDEIVFESESIPLDYSIEYTFVIKDSYGPSDSKLSIDVISNSTVVDNYDDLDALAQYRIYNAEADFDELEVEVLGKTPQFIDQLNANELTEYFEVEFGDYQLKLIDKDNDILTQNRLLTLNQNESKTLVFYRDEELNFNALSFEQSVLPSSYQHEFNIINFINNYDALQVYFIQDDETIESTNDFVKTLTFAKSKSYVINADLVTILLVNEDSLGQKTLLSRLDDVKLDDHANLVLIANEAPEATGGYELKLLH